MNDIINKFDMAIMLIEEAKEEKIKKDSYKKDRDKLPEWNDPNHQEQYEKFIKKYPRTPRKSIINDNLKIARRILLDLYEDEAVW